MQDNLTVVGQYREIFNTLTNQNLPCEAIYQSSGLIKHIQKRHPGKDSLETLIPEIILKPDFVGKNPKEINSIELVKQYDENVMVCIKLDQKDDYLYVASVFEISAGKLQNRINSGRLKKY